ncbi:MAG: hypothetical protein ABI852_21575, partial [Gemmatimonadaceae bacterium]
SLGVLLGALGGGFLFLIMVANGFRKSFGSSAINPALVALPFVAGAVLVAALAWPANRELLHVAAVVAVLSIGLCVWQLIADSATVMWWAIAYLILWLYFYWRTVTPLATH